ncbi:MULTISPECIES: acetaldehyde dehydrogenase (acetylating) [Streptomyces]|jgi:acetaldehyde dehydrogenase|uniref:acetaldehyde dehydrogenase (acetylating) n=1 Tax=Streptomyces TaxID=1883 RepID=UPI0005BD699B|nr:MULTISPECIES: acetaldehyde dehydrogenase (acetylating) [Streptomyces]MCM1944776.1 acetaldehyde dehydrogenase (acetylating) [Streptomyces sp. G2]
MKRNGRLPVAVLGAGLIGVDLAEKIMRSEVLDCVMVVGRDENTPGLRQAADLGLHVGTRGVASLLDAPGPIAMVFDATNAMAHAEHAERLRGAGVKLVDLTPSKVGRMAVPSVNGTEVLHCDDINMISCGGQASIPILHALTQAHRVEYVEVVTTAASPSVGRSTRLNLDEYVETTQDAVRDFTGVKDVKAILNISPARPPATFRVAMSVLGEGFGTASVTAAVSAAADRVRSFVPGYRITACVVEESKVFVAAEVTSTGGRIPRYAGNLDIINSAAVHIAEQCAAVAPARTGTETS